MSTVIYISIVLLGAGALLGIVALFKTRRMTEKMVALDMLTTLTTGLLLVIGFLFETSFILDIAIVYAVLSFGAVIVVARFRERGI